jgi:ferredoxin
MEVVEIGSQCVEVTRGSRLIDVCTTHHLPVVFGCRVGLCGTCLVQVLSEAANLSAPTAHEARLLEVLQASPDWRLACQCTVLGHVRLRYILTTGTPREESRRTSTDKHLCQPQGRTRAAGQPSGMALTPAARHGVGKGDGVGLTIRCSGRAGRVPSRRTFRGRARKLRASRRTTSAA